MRKLLPILVVGILVIGGFGALATNIKKTNNINLETTTEMMITEKIETDVSSLKVVDSDYNYVEVSIGNEELYLMNPGQPMIPRVLKTFELPFGVSNIKVEAEPSGIQELDISKEIKPSSAPLPLTPRPDSIIQSKKDQTVYNSDELYPHDWYSVHIGCGLNGEAERVTHLTVNIFPLRYKPAAGKIIMAETVDVKITYQKLDFDYFPQMSTYDLVIISPSKFSTELQELVEHKNNLDPPVKTILKTTEEIYSEYSGVDEPEEIKLFIHDAIDPDGLNWGITYVLLFGGLKSLIYAPAKDDQNHGSSGWHLPVRYSNFQWDGAPTYNFTSGEPGYISDLYYADIYKYNEETGLNDTFDDWDSNGNGIFAEWSGDELRDELDLYPDVAFGRLAVRNNQEAKDVINKIIKYETQLLDPSWFKRIIAISGDGFLDQEDWNIQWDTNGLPDGEYTIYAQSSNPEEETGPIDEIYITLDKTVETDITFNHDDHLKPELENGYPAPPIAEIMTISNGNTLGNTDYTYIPTGGEAYCNDLYWYANISYLDEVLTIRGKSYDPKT